MAKIRNGRYVHDTDQFGREVLQSGEALKFADLVGRSAYSVFQAIVPRDDNDWANSVSVHTSVQDRNGLRAVTALRSSDPYAREKEFGHYTKARLQLKSGRRSKRFRRVFVPGSHSMTKAVAGVTGGRVRGSRRGRS